MTMWRQISVSFVWNYGTLALWQEDEATRCGKVFGESEHFSEGASGLRASDQRKVRGN